MLQVNSIALDENVHADCLTKNVHDRVLSHGNGTLEAFGRFPADQPAFEKVVPDSCKLQASFNSSMESSVVCGQQSGSSFFHAQSSTMPIFNEAPRHSISAHGVVSSAAWQSNDSRPSITTFASLDNSMGNRTFGTSQVPSASDASTWGKFFLSQMVQENIALCVEDRFCLTGNEISVLKELIPQTTESICSSNLSDGQGGEEMVLEHYRFAVFELTRQNLLLRKQLAAVEERLGNEDAASDCRQISIRIVVHCVLYILSWTRG